ncbi:MAG: sigma 54-interacting transcriptional regulator, partial [Melioribacteraceae bacterium]|nr:sigma 54-interacting transcriptional regulator [Melioribacteraceae bacterium]
NKGTIFLDDIDDFPMNLQSKLLRVLETGIIMPIGGQNPVTLDIRLITASKMNLSEMVAQQRFRMDLFYRINVFPILIPPLRERSDDIKLLVEHFLNYYEPDKKIIVSEEVIDAFINYNWPGNIRELRNVIQSIALFSNGKITLENLPKEIRGDKPLNSFLRAFSHCFTNNNMKFEDIMCCVEYHVIENALKLSEGNQSKAARSLGLSLSTFRDKVKKHRLDSKIIYEYQSN